jgi:hypothetical protein
MSLVSIGERSAASLQQPALPAAGARTQHRPPPPAGQRTPAAPLADVPCSTTFISCAGNAEKLREAIAAGADIAEEDEDGRTRWRIHGGGWEGWRSSRDARWWIEIDGREAGRRCDWQRQCRAAVMHCCAGDAAVLSWQQCAVLS